MEKKDSKQKWTQKHSGLVFALCLVGAAAFSTLFAVNQVKQAEKEKEQIINEEAALQEKGDGAFQPQVDEAMEGALKTDSAANSSAGVAGADGATGEAVIGTDAAGAADGLPAAKDLADLAVSTDGTAAQAADLADSTAAQTANMTDNAAENAGAVVAAQTNEILPTVNFGEEDILNWPVAGSVLIDYSMDGSVYFPTLDQYKYNPALVIGGAADSQVVAAARGIVEQINIDEETGTTVVMNLGDGYRLTYGQLKELNVAEGDVLNQGDLIGYISEPTKYYCKEGSNLYFAMTKDETPVDPILYLE